MEVIFAQEEIEKGDLVTLNPEGHLVKYRPGEPVGAAARRIRKGDAAMLDREKNTKDIIANKGI